MNTLGLGRYVNTLWLGIPYADAVVVEPPLGGGGGYPTHPTPKRIDPEYIDNEQPFDKVARIQAEDQEIMDFVVTLLTKGIL